MTKLSIDVKGRATETTCLENGSILKRVHLGDGGPFGCSAIYENTLDGKIISLKKYNDYLRKEGILD